MPVRPCAAAVALSFGLALAFPGPAAAKAANAAPPPAESRENGRLFQAGMDDYASGDLAAALASFREVLRREPGNSSALAAVRRLESEAAARRAAPRPNAAHPRRPSPPEAFDRFFLVSLPRWFYFERTLGDRLRDLGTLTALNARVVQLMGERKVALAQNRPFTKDLQLRALLRRAPVAALGLEEV